MTKRLLSTGALLIYMFILPGCQKVKIVEGIMDEGQECFEIKLKNATLYYQKSAGRVFFILHKQSDQLTDTFSYLGNTNEGVISPDGMVVFA